jgi:hypothetical protein
VSGNAAHDDRTWEAETVTGNCTHPMAADASHLHGTILA